MNDNDKKLVEQINRIIKQIYDKIKKDESEGRKYCSIVDPKNVSCRQNEDGSVTHYYMDFTIKPNE